jgi:hypothetical protein
MSRLRGILRNAIRDADDRTFHQYQVGDDFRRGPGFVAGSSGPLVGGYAIGHAQKFCLRFRKLLENRNDVRHS